MKRYGACPGAPEPGNFISHGLNLRPGADGHSTLHVVAHGGREAIEVFDVDANGEKPVLTWLGCVLTPDGMQANSVASLADGTLLATIPLRTGVPISDALAGKPTGGVYSWSPGDQGFTMVRGTDLPYANGIEVSADGQEFYVASSGLFTVSAYSNSNPARLLRSSEPFAFVPDNLHMGSDGKLITAGLDLLDPVCGDGFAVKQVQPRRICQLPPTLHCAGDRPTVDAGHRARNRASQQAVQQYNDGAASRKRALDRNLWRRPHQLIDH